MNDAIFQTNMQLAIHYSAMQSSKLLYGVVHLATLLYNALWTFASSCLTFIFCTTFPFLI